MRELTGRVLTISKAKTLALALLVALLSLFVSPANLYAQEPSNTETVTQTGPALDTPENVTATSPTNNRDIVWTWTAPDGTSAPDENGNPTEPPRTDIVNFGYMLTKDSVEVTSGKVEATIYTVTTSTIDNGEYVLSVWSIDKDGIQSKAATGSIKIFIPIPNLAPIEEATIPAPIINTMPVLTTPIGGGTNTSTAPQNSAANTPGYLTNAPSASVLGANNPTRDNFDEVAVAGVAKASTQGWVILGTPWYVWLLILAASYVAMRLLRRYTAHI